MTLIINVIKIKKIYETMTFLIKHHDMPNHILYNDIFLESVIDEVSYILIFVVVKRRRSNS